MIHVAALAFGALRWPWWTLVLLLVANVLWTWLVDLPKLNAFRAQFEEPPLNMADEIVLISLGLSVLASVVLYVVARGLRTLFERFKQKQ